MKNLRLKINKINIQNKSAISTFIFLFILSFIFIPQIANSAQTTFTNSLTTTGLTLAAPSIPSNLNATAVSSTQIDLSWSASTPNYYAIAGYRIFRDGIFLATTTSITYSDTGLSPETNYDYNVEAFDTLIQLSGQSTTATATTTATPVATPTPTPASNGGGGSGGSATGIIISNINIIPGTNQAEISFVTNIQTQANLSWGFTNDFEIGSLQGLAYNYVHTQVITGLTEGLTYQLKITVRGSNGETISKNISFTTVLPVPELGPLPNPSDFVAQPLDNHISLNWVNPTDSRFNDVRIVRTEGFYPIDQFDGLPLYEGDGESFVDTTAKPGVTYYYAIFSRDRIGQYSSGALVQARIALPGEIATTTIADPFANIPQAKNVDPRIRALTLSDFEFVQDGKNLATVGETVAINGDKNLTIKLKYEKVPEILKTVAFTLKDPNDSTRVFPFLLRINSDKTYYEATIGALGKSGRYGMSVTILDYENNGLMRLDGTLAALAFAPVISFSNGFDFFGLLILLLIIILIILGIILVKKWLYYSPENSRRYPNNQKKVLVSVLVIIITNVILFSSFFGINKVFAAFNSQINYQGKLTNSSNAIVSDGNYNIRFKLYTSLSGGSPIWTETWCNTSDCAGTGVGADNRIPLVGGLFSTMLGSTTALAAIDFNQTLYLGVEIGGSGAVASWDGEMSPRKILGAVPAAFVAQSANTLSGLNSTEFFRTDAQNATSSASTFLNVIQTGAGKIAEFFGSASQTVLSILSNGNVGIGTTTPSQNLSVQGNTLVSGNITAANITATGTATFANLLLSGSTTLQNFTALNGTTTNATSTSFFSDILNGASSTLSSLTVGQITAGNFMATSTATSSFTGGLYASLISAPYFHATSSTATSTFAGGLNVLAINQTGSASSTFANGINLAAGCFAISGTCIGSGSGSGTVNSGTTGQFAFYGSNGTAVSATSSIFVSSASNIGIGTTSPWAKLSINPVAGDGPSFVIGSSTATKFIVDNGGNVGIGTSNPNANYLLDVRGGARLIGSLTTNNSTGGIIFADGNNVNKWTEVLNGNDLYFAAGTTLSNSKLYLTSGGNVGIGTTSPWANLSVNGTSTQTVLPLFAVASSTGTATSTAFIIDANGKVGIGTSSPSQQLSVAGDGYFNGNVSASNFTATNSFATSTFAGGVQVNNTINVSSGNSYLYDGKVIANAITSLNNYFFGEAGNLTMSGNKNIGIGYQSLLVNNSGSQNTAIGYASSKSNVSGISNTTIGYNSFLNGTGSNNTAIGFSSLAAASGSNTGFQNTAVGGSALTANTSGQNNTALGYHAGFAIDTGSNNILIGANAGDAITGGSNNIILGYNIDAPLSSGSNQLDIGNLIYGTGLSSSGSTISSGFIGIGSSTPATRFVVAGNSYFDGNIGVANITATGTATFANLLLSGSTTLQNFTALNGTTTNATSTSFFSDILNGASSTLSSLTVGQITAGNFMATSTATSSFTGGLYASLISAPYFHATSSTATSTFAGGLNVSGTSGLTVLQNGFLGLGTVAPKSKFELKDGSNFITSFTTSDTSSLISRRSTLTNSNSDNGLIVLNEAAPGSDVPNKGFWGEYIVSIGEASKNIGQITGLEAVASAGASQSGNVSTLIGLMGTLSLLGSGNVSNAVSIYAPSPVDSGSGSYTNVYGLAIDPITVGTNRYGIFDDSRANSYFSGLVGIGSTSPWANLSINGTSTQTVLPLFAVASSTGTATSTAFIIDANGKVGIGTSSPSQQLSVAGNGYFAGALSVGAGSVMTNISPIGITVSGTGGITAGSGGLVSGSGVTVAAASPVYFSTRSRLYSPSDGILMLQNQAQSGFTRLNFGGTTDAFPALAVSSNSLVVQSSGGGFNSSFGIATSTPWALLSVAASSTNLGNIPLFAVSTSTASATSTAFIIDANGNVGIGTSSPSQQLSIAGGIFTTGSSTMMNGINLTSGCFSINGNCVGSGSGSGTVNSGTTGQFAFYGTNGTAVSATSSIFVSSASNIGIGSTSPWAQLSINPNGISGPSFVVGSSTATSFIVTNGGNVGIGTTSPSQKLDVGGFINTSGQLGGYKIDGATVLQASSTIFSTLIGSGSGTQLLSDSANNTAIGYQALNVATSTTGNIAIGNFALMNTMTTGINNVAIGVSTLLNNTVGNYNTGVGFNALYNNVSGTTNAAVGGLSMFNTVSGSDNVAFGYGSLYHNITGINNVAIGKNTLYYNRSATSSVAIGWSAGTGVSGQTASQRNVFIGAASGAVNTTGGNNVLIGYSSGAALSSGSFNIAIGSNVDLPSNTNSGQLNIGNLLFGTGVHSTNSVSSVPTSGSIGIGTSSPLAKLDIAGTAGGSNPLIQLSSVTSGFATTTRFIINSVGNVGIGTTSPGQMLSVAGDILGNVITGSYFNATSTIASFFPYASTTALTVSGTNGLTLGTLNGPLQAINGAVSASSTLSVAYGGTGVSTAPSYGQLLVGDGNGNYSLTATSSLGILASSAIGLGSVGQIPYYSTAAQAITATSSLFISTRSFIGIGTTTPNSALSVFSTASPQFQLAYDKDNYLTTGVSSSGGITMAVNGSLGGFAITNPQPTAVGSGTGTAAPLSLSVTGATGGNSLDTNIGIGGIGGGIQLNAGVGGTALLSTFSETGGAGGAVSLTGGTGGAAGSPTVAFMSRLAGAGGTVTIAGGTGGAASNGGASSVNTAGAGGAFILNGGVGGNASGATTNNGGSGGSLYITGGAGGTGSSANGNAGNVYLGYNSSNVLGNVYFGNQDISYISSTGNFGIATSSPYAKLSVAGEVVGQKFTATSTTATSTLSGGLVVAGTSGLNVLQGGKVAVGANNPTGKFGVTLNTTFSLPQFASQNVAHFVGADASDVISQMDVFGGHGVIDIRRANGTLASPSALVSDDEIGAFSFRGYADAASYASGGGRAAVTAYAAENWNSTNMGSYLLLSTTPLGSTALSTGMKIGPDGVSGNNSDFGVGTFVPNLFGYTPSIQRTLTILGGQNVGSRAVLELAARADNNVSGSVIGQIDFNAQSQSSTKRIAMITGLLTGSASGDYGSDLAFYTKADGSSSVTEKFRINSAGNVGVGTTSPSKTFSVQGNSYVSGTSFFGGAITATSTLNVTGLTTLGNASTTQIGSTGSAYFATLGGSLGVGTTSPWANLSINGTSTQTVLPLFAVASSTGTATSTAFIIDANGKVGIGTSSPLQQLSVAGSAYFTGNVGIATSSPGALFSVAGNSLFGIGSGSTFAANFGTFAWSQSATTTILDNTTGAWSISTSTDANLLPIISITTKTGQQGTTSINSGLSVGGGLMSFDYTSGFTSVNGLQVSGVMNFDTDAGVIGWADLPISSSATANTPQSYTATIGSTPVLTVYGEADGSGNSKNLRLGVGSTTPFATLSVSGSTTSATSWAFAVADVASTTRFLIQDAGNVGIGTTSPGQKLSVAGDILSSNTITGQSFIANSTSATSTFYGFIDVLGTGTNSTSTISSNLWVKGTLRSNLSYVGDLIFANNFAFTEALPINSTTTQGLYLNNQKGNRIFGIDENGNMNITGDICSKNVACVNESLSKLSSDVGALASSTASLQAGLTTTSSVQSLADAIVALDLKVDAFIASSTLNIDSIIASTSLALASSTDFISAVSSSTANVLVADSSFVNEMANVVKNILSSTQDWVMDKFTAKVAYLNRVEAETVAISKGMEIVDQINGSVWCVTIKNGDWNKVQGNCASVASTTNQVIVNPTPIPTPASTPIVIVTPEATTSPVVIPDSGSASTTATSSDSTVGTTSSETASSTTSTIESTPVPTSTPTPSPTVVEPTPTVIPVATPVENPNPEPTSVVVPETSPVTP